MNRLLLLGFLAFTATLPAQLAPSGKIERVILYRGQALVVRSVALDDRSGDVEVVVPNLPEQIVPVSLFAEADAGVEIRAVRFRATAVSEAPETEVRELDKSVQTAEDAVLAINKRLEVLRRHLETIEKMSAFQLAAAKSDLDRGVLNADAMIKLVGFANEARTTAATEELALAKEQRAAGEALSTMQRRRQELASGHTHTRREAVIFASKLKAGAAVVRLGYLVSGCTWTPAYNIRAAGAAKEFGLEYNAVIQQLSGEDWTGVELALSTATPGLNAASPSLAPFLVALAVGAAPANDPMAAVTQLKDSLNRRQMAFAANNAEWQRAKNFDNNVSINLAANDCQTIELLNPTDVLREAMAASTEVVEGPSLSYALGSKVSVQSRGDSQLVRIASLKLPGHFRHVAAPVLSSFVYREAEINNASPTDLLGGPVSVYLDGAFVGKAEMATVVRGQAFVVGFGADPQLKTRREILDRTEKVQGGNRVVTLKVGITIESFRTEPTTIIVSDRLPTTERPEELRVTVDSTSHKQWDDATYLSLERPKGILRWQVEVPAQATNGKQFALDYTYRLEYDRNAGLTGVGANPEKFKQSYQELELKRNR